MDFYLLMDLVKIAVHSNDATVANSAEFVICSEPCELSAGNKI